LTLLNPTAYGFFMLLWITSYPGSLDHLLLDTLHQQYGLFWYEADRADQSDFLPDEVAATTGQRSAKGKWRKFYEKSLDSDRLVIARTRMPPSDDLPFVYVSREGSAAIRTFYHQQGVPDEKTSLSSTMLGHYLYGDWTSHHAAWKSRKTQANGLYLRIEDLIADPKAVMEKFSGLLPSSTPLKETRIFPDLATLGRKDEDSPDMSAIEAKLFSLLHSASATERGYSPVTDQKHTSDPTMEVPFDDVFRFVEEHRKSVALAGQIHEMSGYIDSLQAQLEEETERLRDYIDVLKAQAGTKKINTK
jgi:hypothetical protein